jgi:hypothetical protein
MIAACNGVICPEGYTVGKDGNARHAKWAINLCGKRVGVANTRVGAVDFAFEHSRRNPRPTVGLADDGVSEDVLARLRSHRAEARARCG